VSNPSTSKRTLAGLRDECGRLCLVAGRHDERLRDVAQALEAERDENRTSAEAIRLAQRALQSGSQLQEMAQSLLARLQAEVAERTQAGAHPMTAVLVVDDLEDARVLMAETLLHAGFIVRTAENGLEALIAAYEWQPAVIVMDITMPVLDGIEATRLIKAAEATRKIHVIAHTAKPGHAEIHLQLFDAVVPKPCTPDTLLGAVREAASPLGRQNH
jgi:two-component system cell cycle response regulator DivK